MLRRRSGFALSFLARKDGKVVTSCYVMPNLLSIPLMILVPDLPVAASPDGQA
jgi:hypothetical protein